MYNWTLTAIIRIILDLLWILLCYLCLMFVFVMLSYLFRAALILPAGERGDFLSLLCVMLSVFCYFPLSGEVLDCIDSRSWPSSLLGPDMFCKIKQ